MILEVKLKFLNLFFLKYQRTKWQSFSAHWKDNFEPNKSYLLKVNNISEFMNDWRECSFIKNELLKFKFKIKQSVRKELR